MKKSKYCLICNNPFVKTSNRQKYCSKKCERKNYYENNKEKIKSKNREYFKEHYKETKEKFKFKKREYFKKWYKKNKIKFAQYMQRAYYKNKEKWKSRGSTRQVLLINFKNEVLRAEPKLLRKKCKNCGFINNLEIHHEVYPIKYLEIRQAIQEGKIYYLCRKCHNNIKY